MVVNGVGEADIGCGKDCGRLHVPWVTQAGCKVREGCWVHAFRGLLRPPGHNVVELLDSHSLVPPWVLFSEISDAQQEVATGLVVESSHGLIGVVGQVRYEIGSRQVSEWLQGLTSGHVSSVGHITRSSKMAELSMPLTWKPWPVCAQLRQGV